MSELHTALDLVERLRSWTPGPGDNASIDSVEAIVLDGQVGLELRWRQTTTGSPPRCFSLIMTVRELLDLEYGSSDRVGLAAASLRLAVQEPHGLDHEGVRQVFRSLP